MFGISGMELMVILLIALLVLGPERLPEVTRWLARVGRELRRAGDEVRMHIDPGLDAYRAAQRKLFDPEKSLPEHGSPSSDEENDFNESDQENASQEDDPSK